MKLAYALCGSFCTHKRSVEALGMLAPGNDITPVLSETVQTTDTRFGKASDLFSAVKDITGNEPITTISRAEETITGGNYDALLIVPCTGNTLAKLAHGITDTAVTMCAKAQLRNRRPVVIALATNDALSANLANIGTMLERKNVYFVPLGQDNPYKKPSSLVCDFGLINETLKKALAGEQIQPLLI